MVGAGHSVKWVSHASGSVHVMVVDAGTSVLDMEAVQAAAAWLRSHLNMHLFGFDVCVEHGTGAQ